MPDDVEPLITITAAAREIGLDRSVLGKQVRSGAVRSHDGKVRLSEVLADRAANIDLHRSRRRDGAIDVVDTTHAGAASAEATPKADEPIFVDGQVLPYREARALKETYLARLRKLEFDMKAGEVVPIDAVVAHMVGEIVIVRHRLLAMPSKLGGRGLSQSQVQLVRDEVHEALTELSCPTRREQVRDYLDGRLKSRETEI